MSGRPAATACHGAFVLGAPDRSRSPRSTASCSTGWPPRPGTQQIQGHLDVLVGDLDAEAQRALSLGATLEEHQPAEGVVVLRNPHGHPFRLVVPGA